MLALQSSLWPGDGVAAQPDGHFGSRWLLSKQNWRQPLFPDLPHAEMPAKRKHKSKN